MHVQFTYPTYVRDGAEGITVNITCLKSALERSGVAVTARWPTVRLTDLNSKLTHAIKGLATVRHLRAGLVGSPDVVHFHTAIPSHSVLARIARGLAPRSTRPMIGQLWNAFVEETDLASSHSLMETLSHRLLNGPALAGLGLGSFKAIIVSSSYQERQLRRVGYRGPVHLIPNGVDTSLFSPVPLAPDPVKRILYVGRLSEEKNLDTLLEAAGALVGRFEIPPPVLFSGRAMWEVRRVLTWFEERAERAAREAERTARRLDGLR